MRTPLVVRWGAKVADPGAIRGHFCHAVDVFSTVLDAAGIAVPTSVDGVIQQPVDGTSTLASITGPDGFLGARAPGAPVLRDDGQPRDLRRRVEGRDRLRAQPVGERETFTGSLDFASDRWSCDEPVAPGPHRVSVQYAPGRQPTARLLVDGVEGASVALPGLFFFPNLSTAATGMLIGRDRGLASCRDDAPPFAFTGELQRVSITSGKPGACADGDTLLRAALASD